MAAGGHDAAAQDLATRLSVLFGETVVGDMRETRDDNRTTRQHVEELTAQLAEAQVQITQLQDDSRKFRAEVVPQIKAELMAELRHSMMHDESFALDAVTGKWKLKHGGVLQTHIADNAVTTRTIADNAVGTNQLQNDSVTAAKLGAQAVTARAVADGSITASKLACAQQRDVHLTNGCVQRHHLAAGVLESTLASVVREGQAYTLVAGDGRVLDVEGAGRNAIVFPHHGRRTNGWFNQQWTLRAV